MQIYLLFIKLSSLIHLKSVSELQSLQNYWFCMDCGDFKRVRTLQYFHCLSSNWFFYSSWIIRISKCNAESHWSEMTTIMYRLVIWILSLLEYVAFGWCVQPEIQNQCFILYLSCHVALLDTCCIIVCYKKSQHSKILHFVTVIPY